MNIAGQRFAMDGPRRQMRGERNRRETVAALAQIGGVGRIDGVTGEPQPALHTVQ